MEFIAFVGFFMFVAGIDRVVSLFKEVGGD
jgi:hypothetical protein